jgi:hypothetical protein
MKIAYIILTLLIGVKALQGQEVVIPAAVCYVGITSAIIHNATDMHTLVSSEVKLPIHSELVQIHKIKSPFATHYTYQQVTNGLPVENAGAKLHIRDNGQYAIENYVYFDISKAYFSEANAWLPASDGAIAVKKELVTNGGIEEIVYTNEYGVVIYSKDQLKYIKRDTTIFVKVFMLNPINSSGKGYGGSISDNNDLSNSTLDSQMYWQMTDAKVSYDTIYLESEFLKFADISAPFDSSFFSLNDSLTFSRDNGDFEFINVYYHINEMGKYIKKLGYDSLIKQLVVDVHAFGNADNSAYSPLGHTLQFGEGGIDDAEDGEVVIHEFTHSLSELASPNNTVGTQRRAMEEGSCDYLAKAYSRTLNDNTPDKVFSWDGNLTWTGIPINTQRTYPTDLKNNTDGDRDMWSSALMCIHDKIGREATDSLLLEHFFYQGANTTMGDMAEVIIDIDKEDFDSKYYSSLKICFVDAGFISRVSVAEVNETPYKIINQQGFASGEGDMRVELPREVSMDVYNVQGNLIKTLSARTSYTLKANDYSKGMYILRFVSDGDLFSQKIIR